MSRNTDYEFISTDAEELVPQLISGYEKITGTTVLPASPEKLFIQWIAGVVLQERIWNNYTGNQNIPSRASGKNLDSLGELFYSLKRPAAQSAVCTIRFYISEAQQSAVLVPAGTRVTDQAGELIWATQMDSYIAIGDTYTDVHAQCTTPGVIGNGYAVGQIYKLIDLYEYYSKCENITTSDYGANEASDDEYYELMRNSMDGFSSAGSRGAYIYIAKQVSTEIADVMANCPAPGQVCIYVLMADGTLATQEIKTAVEAACSDETVRPLTDRVSVKDAEQVTFDVEFTYYIQRGTSQSAKEIETGVTIAVQNYIAWQCGKLGRDIVPDKLRQFLSDTGIKRIDLKTPVFAKLRDGIDNTVPQVASVGQLKITNGGYEDE